MTTRTVLFLAAVLLASCGGPTTAETRDERIDEFEAKVREIIPDRERADRVIATAEDFRSLAIDAQRDSAQFHNDLVALNGNYDATREEFVALFEREKQVRQGVRERLYAMRAQLVENTTEEEWEDLAEARMAAFQAAVTAVRDSTGHGGDTGTAPEGETSGSETEQEAP